MMKKYKVEYSKKAIKNIKKLDPNNKKLIKSWIEKNLVDTQNPRIKGKALTGNLKGLWRYRVGDYRIICRIEDNELIILALAIDHRKNIYE